METLRQQIDALEVVESEPKQAEEVVQESEERFRVVLKDSPIVVFEQDQELRYPWVFNPSVLSVEEMLGKGQGSRFSVFLPIISTDPIGA